MSTGTAHAMAYYNKQKEYIGVETSTKVFLKRNRVFFGQKMLTMLLGLIM